MGTHSEVDVVLLGVGTCGEDLALRLLGAGLEVTGIEASLVGGECPYWACLPSKRMLRGAHLLAEAKRIDGFAGRAEVKPDWPLLAETVKTQVTGGWDDSGAVQRFEERGGRLIKGFGRLVGPATVAVADETVTGRLGIVIATGSEPAIPPVAGINAVEYWTTRDLISSPELPSSVAILGGGAVGCELGQLMARFGTHVTIVEAGERLLPGAEPEASSVLTSALAKESVEVVAGSPAVGVASESGRTVVSLENGERIAADRLLVAAGRRSDLSQLGLENIGLDGSVPFLETDDRMRVADKVWAMGDVTGVALFTHVALYQSAIVAAELLGEPHSPARYDAIPRVTFTDPEVGSVGLTEAEAGAAGIAIETIVKNLEATFRGWLHGGSGVIKLIIERGSGRLVGATTVGPAGGEMLGLVALAVHSRSTVSELRDMIYPFPTFYGTIGDAIGAYGRGLATVMDPGYTGFDHV